MDTPSEASSALDANQAAAEIANLLDPPPAAQPNPEDTAKAPPAEPEPPVEEDKPADPEPVEEASADPDATVTIEVDGKSVEVKKSELADYYKNGLRQADYTKKTMEVAEQRKAAEAEAAKAREERQKYAQGLNQAQALLTAQLQEQSQIDWQKLLDTDPVEYLKQERIFRERQAQLQQVAVEQQQLTARQQAEHAQQMRSFLDTQQQELLAKLPEWKDESKATADKARIKDYLKTQGFDDDALNRISDHRAVLMARKAMLYDQMMDKAQAAAKRVDNLPQKVQRPGAGNVNPLDGRTSAMRNHAKTGSVESAAAVLSRLL